MVVYTRQATAEGIELQFGTNHVGPFLFTNLLLPLLRNAAKKPGTPPGATRVVSLSSFAQRISPARFSDYNLTKRNDEVPPEERHVETLSGAFKRETEDGYNGIVAYGQSKTANVLFTVYLQRWLAKEGIAAYTLHPGCEFSCFFPLSIFPSLFFFIFAVLRLVSEFISPPFNLTRHLSARLVCIGIS